MSVKITGLNELQNQLKQMKKGAEELSKKTSVSFDELFSTSFMNKHTKFSSIDDLFSAGEFEVNSTEDLEAIPDELLDKHVSSCTNFSTWEEMLNEATSEYVQSKLGL